MENELVVVTPELQELASPELNIYSNSYTKYSKARNTLDAYKSDWADFHAWCIKRQCRCFPADPRDVADYLEDRATNSWIGPLGKNKKLQEKQPLKWNSLQRRLTTISKMHKQLNLPFNPNDQAIKDTLSGIKRKLSEEQVHRIEETRKSPTLIDEIRKMIQAIPVEKEGRDHLIGIRDRALLLIGFAGALRRSEIAKIHLEHLTFVKEGIELLIPWSKTGRRDIAIPYGSNPETCPVRTVQDWIKAAGINEGPLFRPINKWGQMQDSAITDKAVVLVIQRNPYIMEKVRSAVEKNSVTSEVPNFGGHSLRAGFVTQSILNGVPEHVIMAHTGHKKSDTLKKYIRQTNKWKDNAATKLGL